MFLERNIVIVKKSFDVLQKKMNLVSKIAIYLPPAVSGRAARAALSDWHS